LRLASARPSRLVAAAAASASAAASLRCFRLIAALDLAAAAVAATAVATAVAAAVAATVAAAVATAVATAAIAGASTALRLASLRCTTAGALLWSGRVALTARLALALATRAALVGIEELLLCALAAAAAERK
jgi:hypothetical protein